MKCARRLSAKVHTIPSHLPFVVFLKFLSDLTVLPCPSFQCRASHYQGDQGIHREWHQQGVGWWMAWTTTCKLNTKACTSNRVLFLAGNASQATQSTCVAAKGNSHEPFKSSTSQVLSLPLIILLLLLFFLFFCCWRREEERTDTTQAVLGFSYDR